MYFGIRWIDVKTDEAADYVRDNLTPADRNIQGDEKYFWWKYMHTENNVNFRNDNSDYIRLFDRKGFDDYMKEAYASIDQIAEMILKQNGEKQDELSTAGDSE